MKRILSFILSAIMIVSCLAVTSFADAAAVDNVEALIDAIGDVKYNEVTEAQTYQGMNFTGGTADGYSNIAASPASAYSLTFYFSLVEADTSTPLSNLSAFTGYGINMGYYFADKQFVIANGGGFNGYPSNFYATKSYEIQPGLLYKMTLVYGATGHAVYLNDVLMCSTNEYSFQPDQYNIIYPQAVNVNIARFIYASEDGATVYEDITDVANSVEWVSRGANYTAAEFTAKPIVDSQAAIIAAEKAYAALSDDDKAAVSNYDKLTVARETYSKAEAASVDAIIDAIGTVNINSLAAIEKAEKSYAALSAAAKAFVTKADVLASARETYDILASVGVVEGKINLVTDLDITDTTVVGGDIKDYPSGMGYTDAGAGNGFIKDDAYLSISYDMNYSSYDASKDSYFVGTTNSYGSSGKIAAGYDFKNQRFFIGELSGFAFASSYIASVDAEYPAMLDPDTWYSVNIVYDRKYVSIYLDGSLILEHEYEENPSFDWYICGAQNVSMKLDNFGWMNVDEDAGQAFGGGTDATAPETTRGEINKGKIQAAIDAYNTLPISRKVMVSNFADLQAAAESIGVDLKDPAEETVELINNIGTVVYKQYPEYTGMTFRGPWGFGYSQLVTNPNDAEGGSGPYSLTYRLIVDEFDKITENSSFGTSSNEWGMYYLMQSKKFVLVKGGFDYTSDKAIIAEAAYELELGLEYDVTYFYGASENAILVNGEKVLSYTFDPETIDPCAPWDGYSITLPKECYVHVISYKYAKEDGTVIAEENLADFGAVDTKGPAMVDPSGWWIGFGDGYKITEFKATNDKYDSNNPIAIAEAAYAALSDEQKNAVSNYDTLTAARDAYDKLAGEYVDALIAEIGEVSIEAGEAKILAAEAAFAELTEAQKGKVTKASTLTEARATYNALANAKNVDDLTTIAANAATNINDTTVVGGDVLDYTNGMGYNNESAADAFFKEDQYLKISYDINYSSYTVTEDGKSTFFAGTTNAFGDMGKIAAGYDFVSQQFFIGSMTHLPSVGIINEFNASVYVPLQANTWYNVEIIYDQKDVYIYFDGALVLEYSYEASPEPQWYIFASKNVSFILDNLTLSGYYADEDPSQIVYPTGGGAVAGNVTETTRGDANKAKIQAAVDAFNKLTADEVDLLQNFDQLVEAAAAIGVTVVDPAVEEVETLINNNVHFVSLANAEKIKAVKAKYDALSDGQKAKVKNAAKLIKVYDEVIALETKDFAVDKVNSMIAGLKGMTAESVADATVMKGIMGQFREVIDGDRYPGYSDFNDSNAKIAEEKYMVFDYDVIVYDYDAVNGYPLLGGYTGISPTVQYVGYDFLQGGFIVANSTGMDNGGIDPEGVECFVEKDFELGVWHHFRVIHDGNKITIEFDGEVVLDHTSNYDRNYAFYIYYPQWINCDLVNMAYTDKSGEVRKSPITKENTANSPGWTMITMDETTLGAENVKSIKAAKAAYDALTDEQKALITDVATLEAAVALIVEPGDANDDGKVNVKDAMAICKYIADWPDAIANMDAADINADGKVNVKDAMEICKLVANS